MASIRKRGDSYQLCYYREGKEKRVSLGKITKAEANRIKREFELQGGNKSNYSPGFEEFATEYLKWHSLEYPDSHDRIYGIVHQHLKPVFRFTDISAIDRKSVEQYKHDRLYQPIREKTKDVEAWYPSPNTIAKELRTLQAMINKAVEWNYLSLNQVKGIKPPKDNEDAPPPFFIKEEIKLIYDNALDPIKTATWMLYLNTGFRRSEGLALKKEWIDSNGIKILSTGGARTKSGKWRIVPHNPKTKKALKVLREIDGDYVLPRVNVRSISRAFDNCLKRAELDGSLHWTRHTYASHLVMSGEPLIKVQKLLGHASIKTTEQYSHLSPEFMNKVKISL